MRKKIPHYLNKTLENLKEKLKGVIYIERWKNVIGYEGYYMVSTFGRVKSLSRKVKHSRKEFQLVKLKILSQKIDKYGYCKVCLCKEGTEKEMSVHRLVGIHFIKNDNNLPEINHLFGIKKDNRVFKLEWSTGSDNMKHAHRIGIKKPTWEGKTGAEHNCSKGVEQLNADGKRIATYGSIQEAARVLKISFSNISAACNRYKNIRTAAGYFWNFI